MPSSHQVRQIARPLKPKPEAPVQVSRQAKISQLGKLVYDENGEVVFPIKLGTLHVDDLGRIEPLRKGFHSESLLFPIGYKSKRLYASIKNANSHCDYVSEVLDGEEGPVFKVTCMDLPDEPFISKSSSSGESNFARVSSGMPWLTMLMLANEQRAFLMLRLLDKGNSCY
mmetsp:Transcript_36031/g.144075  ORF Transcript_36031/g.144075 Transcript_36031/m.144075 type:complete len:170 (+) Transcript_36031:5558-6067(+)